MKRKSSTVTADEARYTARLTLRLTPEEYDVLRRKADAIGCTLSQAVRHSFMGKGSEKSSSAPSVSASMRSVREDFKRIAGQYSATVEAYRRSVEILNRNGRPAVSTSLTLQAVRELQDMTLDLQRSVNSALALAGIKEVHAATRMGLPEAKETLAETLTKKEYILYCIMERIEIIGHLAKDATRYERNGKEKMVLTVTCPRIRKGGTAYVSYTVFAEMNDMFRKLKKDCAVLAVGNFDENENGNKIIFADAVKLLGEKMPEED